MKEVSTKGQSSDTYMTVTAARYCEAFWSERFVEWTPADSGTDSCGLLIL